LAAIALNQVARPLLGVAISPVMPTPFNKANDAITVYKQSPVAKLMLPLQSNRRQFRNPPRRPLSNHRQI